MSLGQTFLFDAFRLIALDKMNQIISHSSVPLYKGQCFVIENAGKKIYVTFYAIDLFIMVLYHSGLQCFNFLTSLFVVLLSRWERMFFMSSCVSLSFCLFFTTFYLWTWVFCMQDRPSGTQLVGLQPFLLPLLCLRDFSTTSAILLSSARLLWRDKKLKIILKLNIH